MYTFRLFSWGAGGALVGGVSALVIWKEQDGENVERMYRSIPDDEK